MKRKHAARFGSISSATMRSDDLIPAFCRELRWLRGSLPLDIAKDFRKWEADKLEDEDADTLVDELFTALDEYAPPYGYFGAHTGDGSDYGFWLSDDFQRHMQDDGVLIVNDTSEVPRRYRGEVLYVNDHGNATFYVSTTRGLREIWSVV
jgi:hypothetical protein